LDGPDLDTVNARAGDVVIVVNLFGRGRRTFWEPWSAIHDSVVIVEDHSHDPLSDWARSSTAKYCIASLRKTLPIPDGAVVWSPQGEHLPPARAAQPENTAANWKLTAMILKDAYLQGLNVRKADFRFLQIHGEALLGRQSSTPSRFTQLVLPSLDMRRLRAQRRDNVRLLTDALVGISSPWTLMMHGPADAVPFGLQLICASSAIRDRVRASLANCKIYAPVHWAQPIEGMATGYSDAEDLAKRILTIPADHRYDSSDMERVLDVLAACRLGRRWVRFRP